MKDFIPEMIRAFNNPRLYQKGHSIQCPQCFKDIILVRWRLDSEGCPSLLGPESLPLGEWTCECGMKVEHKKDGWRYGA